MIDPLQTGASPPRSRGQPNSIALGLPAACSESCCRGPVMLPVSQRDTHSLPLAVPVASPGHCHKAIAGHDDTEREASNLPT
jgi:hypothetical protein